MVNQETAVNLSINKLDFFRKIEEYNGFFAGARVPPVRVNHVPYTTDRDVAIHWLTQGHKVVCRDHLEGREGQGIRIIDATALNLTVQGRGETLRGYIARILGSPQRANLEVLGHARLYTKFIPSTHEYRVHVVNSHVVAVHRKVEGTNGRPEASGSPSEVRNTANGWEFRRVSQYPSTLEAQAIGAVQALGLDFAAVDILWYGSQAWVLETNTAPGIDEMEWTVEQYAIALRQLIQERYNVST